jgi:DNA replication protein DnaC
MEVNQIQTALQSSQLANSTAAAFDEPTFDDVELTDEETKEALRLARREKHFRIARERYEDEMRKPIDFKKYTAEQLFDFFQDAVTYNEKKFILENERYVTIVKNLCCYFTGDIRFKGDLNKGLAMFGAPGSGKTALMKIFQHNQVFSYRVINILEIAEDYKDKGESAVRYLKNNTQGTRDHFGKVTFGLCIDDIGTEEIPAAHFAERKNIFAEVLQLRSLNVLPYATHVTSNKDPKEMESLYGTRVSDRMKEMFNIILFNGIESFRK